MPKVQKIYWTEEEDNLLRFTYPYRTIKQLSEIFTDRCSSVIARRAKFLNLQKVTQNGRGRHHLFDWQPDELEILKEYYPRGGSVLVHSKLTRRNKHSIQMKAAEMGISRSTFLYQLSSKLEISETDKAYIAGLWDGEGTITLTQSNKGKEPRFSPYVSFVNTNDSIIKRITETLNINHISVKSARPGHFGKKIVMTIVVSNYIVYGFLQTLIPYLVKFKRAAELITEFCELRSAALKGTDFQKPIPYSKREIEIIEEVRSHG